MVALSKMLALALRSSFYFIKKKKIKKYRRHGGVKKCQEKER